MRRLAICSVIFVVFAAVTAIGILGCGTTKAADGWWRRTSRPAAGGCAIAGTVAAGCGRSSEAIAGDSPAERRRAGECGRGDA
jgi:hypothetical protein